jgi:hypothetical protein
MFNGKTHYKWPFSIAMLNYQRVYGAFHKWRYPNSWMVYFNVKKSWNIHNWMIWGYPDLRKP